MLKLVVLGREFEIAKKDLTWSEQLSILDSFDAGRDDEVRLETKVSCSIHCTDDGRKFIVGKPFAGGAPLF
ncbi:MAG: hypothetical protein KGJ53_07160 [Alphaproteobacteria bacterium]|nr:hypothetical protein [Alphaproteobacteria bacterium]